MRLTVLVSSISVLGLLTWTSGCSTSDTSGDVSPIDAGVDSGGKKKGSSSGDSTSDDDDEPTPGKNKDSGTAPPGDLTSTALKSGAAQLIGVTSGSTPMVVYLAVQNQVLSLEAVAPTGGTPTVIATDLTGEEDIGVNGGAVWWYTALNAGGLGTLNFWTKANGAKTAVATGSIDGFFWASEDGSRVAFSVGGAAKTTEVAVTSSATPAATAVLTGNYAVDFPTDECFPDIGFVGTTLFAAFCSVQTAGSPNSSAARVVAVDAAGTVKRLDATGNGNNTVALSLDKSLWHANTAGTKLFVIGSGASAEGRIIDVAAAPAAGSTVALESAVTDGFLLDDGSAVYTTGTAIKRGTGSGASKTLTTATVKAFLSRSAGGDRVLFRSLDTAGDYELHDLRAINTSTENQAATDLIPTASVSLEALINGGSHVLYRSNLAEDPSGALLGKLEAKPIGGGAAVQLATSSLGGLPVPGSTGIVNAASVKDDGDGNLVLSLEHVDAISAAALPISDDVLPNAWDFVGKTFIYTRAGATPGIYVVELP
ncbi:MAG: hypothetical protein K0S65_3666 [Labilithrix sp.]|nr:hypothetical protein [Labilithrix sp.]